MFERMKSYSYFLLVILCLASCQKKEFIREINITNWEFREQGSEWLPATVPGFVHLDLYDNGLIEDPFYRDNENKLQWIEEKSWEYKAEFNLDVDGSYRGTDLEVHNEKNFNNYTVFSLWDTYRATHPLFTIIDQSAPMTS